MITLEIPFSSFDDLAKSMKEKLGDVKIGGSISIKHINGRGVNSFCGNCGKLIIEGQKIKTANDMCPDIVHVDCSDAGAY